MNHAHVPSMSAADYLTQVQHAPALTLATHPVDEPDLLALLADEHTTLGKPLADAFRAACETEARVDGSFDGDNPPGPYRWVNPSRVRALVLDHPSYEPRQYAALWSVGCARGGYMTKTERLVAITGEGSRGNTNKSTFWRRWVA